MLLFNFHLSIKSENKKGTKNTDSTVWKNLSLEYEFEGTAFYKRTIEIPENPYIDSAESAAAEYSVLPHSMFSPPPGAPRAVPVMVRSRSADDAAPRYENSLVYRKILSRLSTSWGRW